jgi:hypothetical protein
MLEQELKEIQNTFAQIDSGLIFLGLKLQHIDKLLSQLEETYILKFSKDPYAKLKMLAKRLKL